MSKTFQDVQKFEECPKISKTPKNFANAQKIPKCPKFEKGPKIS